METTLRMKAPTNQVTISIPLDDGGVQTFTPEPDGTLDVPLEHLDALKSNGWTAAPARPMTDFEIGQARRRRVHLQDRREDLSTQLAAARVQASELAGRHATAREDLSDGRIDVAELGMIARESGSASATEAELTLALQGIDSALSEVSAAILAHEMTQEAARQEEQSEGLRVDALSALDFFFEGLAYITDPLRKLHEIRLEVAAKYPLATQVPPVRLDALARVIEKNYPATARWGSQVRAGNSREHILRWLRVVLDGAIPYEDTGAKARDRAALGLEEPW